MSLPGGHSNFGGCKALPISPVFCECMGQRQGPVAVFEV